MYFADLLETCVLDNPAPDVILGNTTSVCVYSPVTVTELDSLYPVTTRANVFTHCDISYSRTAEEEGTCFSDF